MTLLRNSAEGQASGTVPSSSTPNNTGGASGDQFDVVNIGSGAALTFDSTHVAHGAAGYKVSTGATSTTSLLTWNATSIPGAPLTVWMRNYIYLPANPSAQFPFMRLQNGGASQIARVSVNTTGKVVLFNTANSAVITSTKSLNVAGWSRVEVKIGVGTSTSNGVAEMRLYTSDMDSANPDEYPAAVTNANFTTTGVAAAQFGVPASTANVAAYWFDDVALSDTDWVGAAMSPQAAMLMG